jgi:SAM-dependent methyltransferase
MKSRLYFNSYKKNEYFKKPKKIYSKIGKIIFKEKLSNYKVLDVGFGNGSFINYLYSEYGKKKNINITGIEPDNFLYKNAKKNLPKKIKIHKIGLFSKKTYQLKNQFDYVICLGVVNLFDDLKITINKFKSFINLNNKNSKIIIFSKMNPYDVDVISRYKFSDEKKYKIGQNLFSIKTLKRISKEINLSYNIKKFELDFNIKKSKKDPMRSWTRNINKKRSLFDGFNRIIQMYIITLKLR